MKKKIRRTLFAAIIGFALLFGISYAVNDDLLIVHYGVAAGKLSEVVRIASCIKSIEIYRRICKKMMCKNAQFVIS